MPAARAALLACRDERARRAAASHRVFAEVRTRACRDDLPEMRFVAGGAAPGDRRVDLPVLPREVVGDGNCGGVGRRRKRRARRRHRQGPGLRLPELRRHPAEAGRLYRQVDLPGLPQRIPGRRGAHGGGRCRRGDPQERPGDRHRQPAHRRAGGRSAGVFPLDRVAAGGSGGNRQHHHRERRVLRAPARAGTRRGPRRHRQRRLHRGRAGSTPHPDRHRQWRGAEGRRGAAQPHLQPGHRAEVQGARLRGRLQGRRGGDPAALPGACRACRRPSGRGQTPRQAGLPGHRACRDRGHHRRLLRPGELAGEAAVPQVHAADGRGCGLLRPLLRVRQAVEIASAGVEGGGAQWQLRHREAHLALVQRGDLHVLPVGRLEGRRGRHAHRKWRLLPKFQRQFQQQRLEQQRQQFLRRWRFRFRVERRLGLVAGRTRVRRPPQRRRWSIAAAMSRRRNTKSHRLPPICRHSTAERNAASSRARISATTPAWPR